MSYSEIVRTAADRTMAMADVSRIMGTASERATSAGLPLIQANARAPFELIEHDPETVEKFLRWFERTPEWRPDGNCLNRTMLGIHALDEMSGLKSGPASDVFAGAIHTELESTEDFLKTATSPEHLEQLKRGMSTGENAHLSGRFHGTLALRVRGHEDPIAVDFKAKRPVVHFNADNLPERTELIRPYAGSGAWDNVRYRPNYAASDYFDGAKRFLNDAIGASTMRIDRSAALEDAVRGVHAGYARPAVPDDRLMSRIVNDDVTFD